MRDAQWLEVFAKSKDNYTVNINTFETRNLSECTLECSDDEDEQKTSPRRSNKLG